MKRIRKKLLIEYKELRYKEFVEDLILVVKTLEFPQTVIQK